jgi:hypothetical protein
MDGIYTAKLCYRRDEGKAEVQWLLSRRGPPLSDFVYFRLALFILSDFKCRKPA